MVDPEAAAPEGTDQESSGQDEGPRGYKRRQYIVDKNLQYYYLTAWLSAVVLFVLVGFAFFVMFKVQKQDSLDMERLDLVYRMLLLNSVFLILFAILMGLHSILHTHRIAGAAYHIREHLKRMNDGKLVSLTLRKKDYLKDVAEEINRIKERLEGVERTKEEVIQQLDAAGDGDLPDELREKVSAVRELVSAL